MKALYRVAVPILLLALCAALLLQWIDLTTSDLGRHLRSGQVLVHGSPEERGAILHTNLFSYAEPIAPFVYHSWLSGVLFYLVWESASFPGLTILYTALVALAVLLAYESARRASNAWAASALTLLAIPMIVWRWDVRPDAFTFLLAMLFWFILAEWHAQRLRGGWLWLLPPLMCLWINLHIGFVVGLLLLAVFAIKVDRTRLQQILLVTSASLAAALLNPSHIRGVLYPFGLLAKTEYPAVELGSLGAIRARGLWTWEYELFVALLILTALILVLRRRTLSWPDVGLLTLLGALGALQVRAIPIFLLLMIPALATAAGPWFQRPSKIPALTAGLGIVAGLACIAQVYFERPTALSLGLRPGSEAFFQFIRDNPFGTPVFNNADIGADLIWHGIPVFTDTRFEAYPAGFFEHTYMPMLTTGSIWQEMDARYTFNAIIVSMQDPYPGVESFILNRAHDPEWAPVYADEYAIVFLRETEDNAATIARHRIPRERFR